jgi:transcriptional regulator with XRE-family HTH domain
VKPREQLGANLRRAREGALLTQEGLAHRANVSSSEISKIERALKDPKLTTLVRLARGLDIRLVELVADVS